MKHILKYSWGCLLALAPARGDGRRLDSCRNAFFHRIGFACGNTAVCIYR